MPCRVSVAGHDMLLFMEAPPLIEALVEDIRKAQHRVWVEVYIFYHDTAGTAIADALKDRAKAGLDVRVLYDAIGSQSTPSWFFRDLEKAGVQVHCFHTIWEAFWRFSFLRILNRRNHRKVVVIDDQVAYFGGMNLIDPTSDANVRKSGNLPSSGSWRDVHARLQGPQQAEVAESYERSWRRAHGERVSRRPRSYRVARLDPGVESIQFFDTGPGLRYTRASRIFCRLITMARRNISISMAYFIPVGRVLRELFRARQRGVRIRVIVPGNSDVKLAQWASSYLYRKLLRRRINLYERQQDMLHSKVMVIDDEWTILGSSNMDARSLYINLEFMAVIHSREMAAAVNAICKYELEHSRRITLPQVSRLSRWVHLRNRLAWSLRWWL